VPDLVLWPEDAAGNNPVMLNLAFLTDRHQTSDDGNKLTTEMMQNSGNGVGRPTESCRCVNTSLRR